MDRSPAFGVVDVEAGVAAESGVVAEEAVMTASVLAGPVELGVCEVSEASRVAVLPQNRLES